MNTFFQTFPTFLAVLDEESILYISLKLERFLFKWHRAGTLLIMNVYRCQEIVSILAYYPISASEYVCFLLYQMQKRHIVV